uniref:Uncharacterized protein n=1 Tax=Oryza rufipogon TaxID=4529 RepID=A0A0E0QQX9_ORYRU
MPALLQTWEEEEGKEKKGKEGSEGNRGEDGNEGFDYRPWTPRIRGIELLIYAAFIGRLSVICVMLFGWDPSVGSVMPLRNATSVHLIISEGK